MMAATTPTIISSNPLADAVGCSEWCDSGEGLRRRCHGGPGSELWRERKQIGGVSRYLQSFSRSNKKKHHRSLVPFSILSFL